MTVDQGAFFAKSELEFVNLSAIPPAPEGYELPTCFPRIHEAKRVSVDLETHDPDLRSKGPGVRRDGYIVGVGVAIDDGPDTPVSFADYYPIRHMNGPNLDPAHVMQWLKDELNTFRGEIVGANVCLYDGDYLQEYGVRPERAKWRDVQWAEALIDEEAPDYKLNTLAKKYLGLTKVTDELTEKYGPEYITNFEKVHPGHAKPYVMGDIHLPLGILNKQHEALRSEGMVKLFDLECRLTPFLLYLRQKGVRVDLQKALKFNDVLAEKRDEQLQILSSLAGFKITADTFEKKDVLVRALDACGVKYPRTEKGAPSIVRQWLDHLEHPFGKVLNAVRKYDKARGTFVESYILENHINGRIHGEFHPLRRADEDGNRGTVSGRFSGTHPNLQNIPSRDEEIGPLCRSMFIPEEGFNWWSLDYSQIEYRFLVHYAVAAYKSCKDPKRKEKLKTALDARQRYIDNPGMDFHQGVADMTGLPRKAAKNLNFGLVYGMGKNKLAASLGLVGPDGQPLPEAVAIMDAYHGKAPFIRELYQMASERAQSQGYIKTILNRRSRFNLWEPKYTERGAARPMAYTLEEAESVYGKRIKRAHTHKALNRILQGSAADLMKLAMVTIWESGLISEPLAAHLTVHDELDGSVEPSERGKEAHDEARHIMETCMTLELPILTGGETGANWAEAH